MPSGETFKQQHSATKSHLAVQGAGLLQEEAGEEKEELRQLVGSLLVPILICVLLLIVGFQHEITTTADMVCFSLITSRDDKAWS